MAAAIGQQFASSGKPAVDAVARQREAAHPPVLAPAACECCGGATGPDDFWVFSWAYYVSRLGLLSALSLLAGKGFLRSREVRHATFHWLCRKCGGAVR